MIRQYQPAALDFLLFHRRDSDLLPSLPAQHLADR
jgi:hypothetical protein